MKFNIYGFNQEKLVSKYSMLNGNDIIVLRVFSDMLPRMTRSITVNGHNYKQLTYELLLQDVPFVTQSVSTLKKIVKKLIEVGLIDRVVVNNNGKYTYFRKTADLIDLEAKDDNEDESDNKRDLEDRIEYVEQVLTTRASREIISELKQFKDQYEFFHYFDNFILPDKKLNKRHTCKYVLKGLKTYFSGEFH